MPKTLHPLFLAAILIAAAIPTAAASPPDAAEAPPPNFSVYPRVYVQVWDRLPASMELIRMVCKSADDDIGFQFLMTDTAYEFSFHPNVWGGTLFSCVAAMEYGRVGFNAYEFDRDYKSGRCVTECVWNARPDGMHGVSEDSEGEDIFYPWGL